MIEKPPRPVVSLPVHISCRGCYVLGSACGICAKCLKEWEAAEWDEILAARRANEIMQEAKNKSDVDGLNKRIFTLEAENKRLDTQRQNLLNVLHEIQRFLTNSAGFVNIENRKSYDRVVTSILDNSKNY